MIISIIAATVVMMTNSCDFGDRPLVLYLFGVAVAKSAWNKLYFELL